MDEVYEIYNNSKTIYVDLLLTSSSGTVSLPLPCVNTYTGRSVIYYTMYSNPSETWWGWTDSDISKDLSGSDFDYDRDDEYATIYAQNIEPGVLYTSSLITLHAYYYPYYLWQKYILRVYRCPTMCDGDSDYGACRYLFGAPSPLLKCCGDGLVQLIEECDYALVSDGNTHCTTSCRNSTTSPDRRYAPIQRLFEFMNSQNP